MTTSQRALTFMLPVLAIAQATGYFSQLTGLGVTIAERSAANDTAAVPAGYAFAIWGVIFAWSLLFALWQALPVQRDNHAARALRAPAAAAWTANTIWELNAQFNGIAWESTVIILALVLAALWGVFRIKEMAGRLTRTEWRIAAPPLLLLAGWGTVAAFAQISTLGDIVAGDGSAPLLRDTFLVLCAGALGSGVAWALGRLTWYSLAGTLGTDGGGRQNQRARCAAGHAGGDRRRDRGGGGDPARRAPAGE